LTTTTYKGAYLPVVAGDGGVWGDKLNSSLANSTFPTFDSALGGIVTKSLTNANVTLSAAEAQNAILYLTGTLTGNVIITTPCQGFTLVNNTTTGAHTVTFRYTGGVGSTATIPQGVLSLVATDATNGAYILSIGSATLSSLTVSGTATFSSTVVLNGTTYTFGAGASSALRASLELSQSITASGTLTIDVNSGFDCDVSLTGTVTTFNVSNWPAAGKLGKLTLSITNTGAFNVTGWPGTTYWPGGVAPTITSGASKRDTIVLTSSDGGSTFRGYIAAQNLS
jgi:hypothetical protein